MRKLIPVAFVCVVGIFLAAPLAAQDHLLITEFVVSPTAGEFVEIHNPTANAVDLSNYYLSDATFAGGGTYYYNTVTGNGGGGGFADFNARFPAGASIAPGEFQTIALNGSDNFTTQYGVAPTYELYEDGGAADGIPDMLEATPGSINNQGGLSNDGEVVVLFYWDGASDLVQDVDYVVWGDKAEAVDKTGVKVDGPDADSDSSTYLPDMAIVDQFVVNAENDADPNPHNDGASAQRRLDVEDLETWAGGNGITGHNEIGENTSWKGGIWSINEPATPGRRALSPYPAADSLTIADVQFIRADDIGTAVNDDTPFNGDTLTITATVMHGMREIFLGNRWGGFIEDARGGPWSGFFVIQNDTSSPGVEGTLLTAANPGDVIKITGIMSEFPTGAGLASITQFVMITDPVTPIEFVDFGQPLPAPVLLKPGDLGLAPSGTSADPKLSERWEGVLARFENLTVLANNLPGNTMTASDESGTIILDDYFGSVSTAVTNNGNAWPGVPAGTKINVTGFVRGGTSTGEVTINPRTLNDIEIASVPPNITGITRTPIAPTSAQGATISANIVDADGSVAAANILYSVDNGAFQTVAMTTTNDTAYTGVIPQQADGAFVQYFLESADNEGNTTTIPPDTSAAKLFYFVRDGGLTIFDLQFTPFANGNSSFADLQVTVTGIVTTDTTDFSFYWIQDGTDTWSGIWVNDNVNQVTLGDEVSVTGTVQEVQSFNVTRISNVTNVTVLSRGNPVPAPVVVSTGDLRTGSPTAESYEGMLVRVVNAGVANPFADGSSNFGEFTLDDGSGEVRVDDLGNFRGNLDTTFAQGDSLISLTGIHHFTFSNYKIEPRNDNDVVRKTTAVEDRNGQVPLTFALDQNYPNPFNPETIIRYQIARSWNVTLEIFNVLGQKIRTLVDKEQAAGAYTIQWDGVNDRGLRVPSGVYFYKMQSADFRKVRKLLLLK